MRPAVLITDGDQRAALAVTRSLGKAGYRCVITSSGGRSLAGASKYATREFEVPAPDAHPSENAAATQRLVESERIDLLLPITEASLLALLPSRDRISASIPFPDVTTFAAICDKARVLEAAATVGIRVPHQQEVRSAEEATTLKARVPVVLKPSRSVYTAPDGSRGKVSVRWVHEAGSIAPSLRGYPEAAFPVLVQEAVQGPGVGIFILLNEGRVIASFSHRRMREKPPSGGVSALRQSEPMDEKLLERSIALLERFDWSGVAMVEYKRDHRTGEPVLMEINGRFWGSLQLAIDAGVDFPSLLAAVSFGESVSPVHAYGFVRSRWFWGDVDHLIAQWRDPGVAWGTRLRALGGFLRAFGPGYRSEVFRLSDPRPFAVETAQWFADLTRR